MDGSVARADLSLYIHASHEGESHMPGRTPKIATIDDYIESCGQDVQPILLKIRATIHKAVPAATETISYRMPAFKHGRILLYFAAFKQHIGLYPPVRDNAALVKAVARYAGPKGNLKFPLDQPIPYALIARIAVHRSKRA
jgi:uncharacterized protein YdhG (YjbR/CyaY superfamily)